MVNPFSVISSGCPAVLVDGAAEAIASLHGFRRQPDHYCRLTEPAPLDFLVWTGLVVVVDELHQHAVQEPAPEDQHLV